jgi:hypothetical protein
MRRSPRKFHATPDCQSATWTFPKTRNAMLDQDMPEWQVTALLELQRYYTGGQGGTVDTVLEKLLGRPPIKMDQFLAEVASEFRPQAANA